MRPPGLRRTSKTRLVPVHASLDETFLRAIQQIVATHHDGHSPRSTFCGHSSALPSLLISTTFRRHLARPCRLHSTAQHPARSQRLVMPAGLHIRIFHLNPHHVPAATTKLRSLSIGCVAITKTTPDFSPERLWPRCTPRSKRACL
jgi:hypothetical protein